MIPVLLTGEGPGDVVVWTRTLPPDSCMMMQRITRASTPDSAAIEGTNVPIMFTEVKTSSNPAKLMLGMMLELNSHRL